MWLSKLPWWSGFPMSAGMGVMGIFAPSVLPDWWQKAFFFAGAAFFVWGLFTAFWHFRIGRWFDDHVRWRFRLRQPSVGAAANPVLPENRVVAATSEPEQPPLTQADRERGAAIVRDVHDFIIQEARPFRAEITQRLLSSPLDFISATPTYIQQIIRMCEKAGRLHDENAHYLEMMDIQLEGVSARLNDLIEPMHRLADTTDWPDAARRERAEKLRVAIVYGLAEAEARLTEQLQNARDRING